MRRAAASNSSPALATKLLAYATGRRIEPAERPQIERIVEQLKQRGGGLRDLVHLVAESPLFLSQ